MTPETQANQDPTAAASAAPPADEKFGAIDPPADPALEPQPEDLKAQRRAELQKQLDDLEEKPKPLEERSIEDLHIDLMDELVLHLGSHPRLAAIWQEIRKRLVAHGLATPTSRS